jgi:hypothetical protein
MNAPQKKPTAAKSLGEQIAETDKQVESNLRIWNALRKTDPKHTKPFSRAGGFKGTALKPIWIVQLLTEQFGPVGEGWGMGRPEFQVVEVNGETLVYCTAACWHTNPENVFYGVGGDKVSVKRQNGPFNDDEAFKKAFTDAVNNAFKFAGVGADIHMGLFEDSKYLAEVTAEFHPPEPKLPEDLGRKDGDMAPSALKGSLRMLVHHINGCGTVAELEDLLDTEDAKEVMENCERRFPAWWSTGENMPAEFVPLKKLIEQTRDGLRKLETVE